MRHSIQKNNVPPLTPPVTHMRAEVTRKKRAVVKQYDPKKWTHPPEQDFQKEWDATEG